MLFHYWKIGNYILYHQNLQGWGSKIIKQLAKAIRFNYPEKKGYSERNLTYMCQFARSYPLNVLRSFIDTDARLSVPSVQNVTYAIGFTKDMVNSLLTKKEAIQCNGKIFSEEHRRKFEIKNDVFKVENNPTDDRKLILTINKQPIGEWFKEQWEKLRHGLRQSAEEPRKSRGFRM